ncbi:hypothetical protein GCM10026982_52730 [Nocardiopsis aegyptia]
MLRIGSAHQATRIRIRVSDTPGQIESAHSRIHGFHLILFRLVFRERTRNEKDVSCLVTA